LQLAALGRLAACQRLAGQSEAMNQSLSDVVKRCPKQSAEAWYGGAVLLVNGRISDGIDLMYQHDKASGLQLLCSRSEYREALGRAGPDEAALLGPNWLALLGTGSANDERAAEGFRLGCEMVRILHRLGEKEKARDLLATLVAVADRDKDAKGVLLASLSVCEIELGFSEAAAEHVARLLARHPDQARGVFTKMFPGQFEIADVLWRALCGEYAGEKEAALLGRLQKLLAAGAPAAGQSDELRKLGARLEMELRSATKDARGAPLLALASFCQSRGHDELAGLYAEKAAAEALPPDSLLKVGNVFADQKRWDRAARAYENAWSKDCRNAAALYLLGHARLQSGKQSEGRRQMELALLLPLGDSMCRYHLIETLKRLGLQDEVIRQCKLTLATGPFGDWAGGQALERLGNDASLRGDRLAAADCWERFALGLLQPNTFLLDNRGYLILPFRVHASRGRGLLKAGKIAEALEELRQAEAAIPGNVEFVLGVVPELEKAGRKAEADALFQRAAALHEDLCREFPRSAGHHNDLAWLAASLDRELDKALAHARRAVELEPDRAAYLDTLAEVHFRRGDRDEAARLMKRCIELDPKNDYFRKQLDRFQATTTGRLENPR
jgi:tetratricopeptide (TPR) repeat protein